MKIEITFSENDVRRLIAEHCRRQFKIDPKNVAFTMAEPDGKNQYFAKVEGDYKPE